MLRTADFIICSFYFSRPDFGFDDCGSEKSERTGRGEVLGPSQIQLALSFARILPACRGQNIALCSSVPEQPRKSAIGRTRPVASSGRSLAGAAWHPLPDGHKNLTYPPTLARDRLRIDWRETPFPVKSFSASCQKGPRKRSGCSQNPVRVVGLFAGPLLRALENNRERRRSIQFNLRADLLDLCCLLFKGCG